MGNVKNGKFVYKNEDSLKKMHEFYDKTLASLDVPYSESPSLISNISFRFIYSALTDISL